MDFLVLRATSNMRLFLLRVSTLCSFICYKALMAHRAHRIMTFFGNRCSEIDTEIECSEWSHRIKKKIRNRIKFTDYYVPGSNLSLSLELLSESLLEPGASLFCYVSSPSMASIMLIYDSYIQNVRTRCDIWGNFVNPCLKNNAASPGNMALLELTTHRGYTGNEDCH